VTDFFNSIDQNPKLPRRSIAFRFTPITRR
jgi:hypothetical protein